MMVTIEKVQANLERNGSKYKVVAFQLESNDIYKVLAIYSGNCEMLKDTFTIWHCYNATRDTLNSGSYDIPKDVIWKYWLEANGKRVVTLTRKGYGEMLRFIRNYPICDGWDGPLYEDLMKYNVKDFIEVSKSEAPMWCEYQGTLYEMPWKMAQAIEEYDAYSYWEFGNEPLEIFDGILNIAYTTYDDDEGNEAYEFEVEWMPSKAELKTFIDGKCMNVERLESINGLAFDDFLDWLLVEEAKKCEQ